MTKQSIALSLGIILCIVLLLSAPLQVSAGHESDEEPPGRAEELAREGMDKLMQALETLLQTIPQYEMPEITDDGDIIIRRKRSEGHVPGPPPRPPARPGEPDATDT